MHLPDEKTSLQRRRFLQSGLAGGAAALLASRPLLWSATDDPWAQLPGILAKIKAPKFPDRDFPVTQYGGKGDNKTDCTEAFQKAIAACSAAGGGRVLVTGGEFMTGPIHLKNNVNVHIDAGATIRFYREPKRYLPAVFSRFEGTELMNYSPFFYAFGQQNIGITGKGTIDGNADCDHWWGWKGRTNCGWKKGEPNYNAARNRLLKMAEDDVPVAQRTFGEGDYLRPNFIQPYKCENIVIEDITIVNSPMWEINPVLCTNVTVRNVKINSHGPNNDGCDPESSRYVLIEGCEFDTGDDCIAIKSGRNRDGRRIAVPSEYIIVRNCTMKDGHGGVSIGSEISGDCRYVFAENCKMDSPHLDRILRLKSNAMRGGVLEHIYMRNITAGQVAGPAIDIDFQYEEGPKGKFKPIVRDVEVRNVTCKSSDRAWSFSGYADDPIQDVRLIDCTFEATKRDSLVENVKGLSITGVKVNGKPVSA